MIFILSTANFVGYLHAIVGVIAAVPISVFLSFHLLWWWTVNWHEYDVKDKSTIDTSKKIKTARFSLFKLYFLMLSFTMCFSLYFSVSILLFFPFFPFVIQHCKGIFACHRSTIHWEWIGMKKNIHERFHASQNSLFGRNKATVVAQNSSVQNASGTWYGNSKTHISFHILSRFALFYIRSSVTNWQLVCYLKKTYFVAKSKAASFWFCVMIFETFSTTRINYFKGL